MDKTTQSENKKNRLDGMPETLILATPDFLGRLVGRRIIIDKSNTLRKISTSVCSSIFAWDIEQNPIESVQFAGFHTGWQDLRVEGNYYNRRPLSWLNNTDIIIADAYYSNNSMKEVLFAPRSILKKEVDRLQDMGFKATVATELEFYLFPIEDSNKQSANRHDFSVDVDTNKMASIFDEIIFRLKQSHITVESWQAEWGISQWEINMTKGNPLEVADSHTLFKLAVKDIALKHGYRANFMAKPLSSHTGSSSHIHISLQDKNNRQVFFNKKSKTMLSGIAEASISGILHNTSSLMPLYANTINSYKRLAASEFCGNGATWGFDNRTTTCRVIGHSPQTLHIEFRLPGADINPYLALAGLIASVRDGITQNRKAIDATSGDAGISTDKSKYPLSLDSAIKTFMVSAFVRKEFPDEFIKEYSAHIQHEVSAFQHAVTDWEINRYELLI